MASRPFQFLEKNAPKFRQRSAKHFEGLAALPTHSAGRRVVVKASVNPFISALAVARCPATFPGVWPQLRDTLSTSRSVARGTGTFIYTLSTNEISPPVFPFPSAPSYQSASPGTMAQSAGFGPQNEPQVEKPRRSACAGHEKPPPGVALPGASCWHPTVLWCLFSCGALRAPPSPRRWASPCPSTAGRTRPPGRAPCPARSWWGSPPGGPASGRQSPPENR